MDNDNDNIFAERTGEPESGPIADNGGIPGSDSIPAGRIDPALAFAASTGASGNSAGGNATGNPPKRGRHPNSCNCANCIAKRGGEAQAAGGVAPEPKPEKTRAIRATFVEKSLMTLHLIAASALKAPELNLDKDDAKLLGAATADVLAYYKVKMTPKQEAYGLLMEAAAQVYPPMLMSLYIRKKFEWEEAKKHSPKPIVTPPPAKPKPDSNVTDFRSAATPFNPFKIDMPGS